MPVIEWKKNTAYYLELPIIDAASPASFKTGESPTFVAYSKDGAGSWTSLSVTDSFSEIGSTGVYALDLTAGELNHDRVWIKVSSTNGADTLVSFVLKANDIDSFNVSGGVVEANVKQIDGQATNDNNATLKLKQLDVQNSAGSAVIAKSTGSNGYGITAEGNGSGYGIRALGGDTSHGLGCIGGATSGNGAHIAAQGDGYGAHIRSGTGSSKSGLRSEAMNGGNGFECIGNGAGAGTRMVPGATGIGCYILGGSTSGDGLKCHGQGDGYGIQAITNGSNKSGIRAKGHGTAAGLSAEGGDSGHGAHFLGGSTSGNGATFEKQGGSKDIDADELLTTAQVNAEVDTAFSDWDPPTQAEMNAKFDALNDLTYSEITSACGDALNLYDPPTKTEMDNAFAALNDLSSSDVETAVGNALATYDPPTKAEMDAAFAALNDLSAAQVNAEVDTALADIRLDEIFSAAISGAPTADSLLDDLTEDDSGVLRFNANALEQAPSGGGATAAEVWSYGTRSLTDKAGFTISGTKTTLDALNDLSAAAVNAEVDTALADIRLDEIFSAAISGAPYSGSLLDDLTEDDSGVLRFNANALEESPSGGGATAAEVWSYGTRALTDKAGFTISGTKQTLDALNDVSTTQVQTSCQAAINALFNITAGVVEANMIQINGGATTGYNADLKLKSIMIENSAGSALVCKSTGGNGQGIAAEGNGGGYGLRAIGGVNGHGIGALGGSTTGHGILAQAIADGFGFNIQGPSTGSSSKAALRMETTRGNSNAFECVGFGSGAGIRANAGATGIGAYFLGGSTSGDGFKVQSQGDGFGFQIVALGGDRDAIRAVGNGTGSGMKLEGGASNGIGLELIGAGTGKDLDADEIDAILPAIAALNDLSAAEVKAEVDASIEDYRLDELLAAELSGQPYSGSLFGDLTEDDGGTQRFNANALEQAPTGGTNPNVLINTTIATIISQTEFTLAAGSDDDEAYLNQLIILYDASDSDDPSPRVVTSYEGATKTVEIDQAPVFTIVPGDGVKIFATAPGTTAPTAAQVADAVLNELISEHLYAGTLATFINDIKAKTDNLPSDPADQSAVESFISSALIAHHTVVVNEINANETKIDAIKERTDNLPDDPADHSLVMDQITATGTAVQTAVITEVNANETKIDGIKERTDNLPDDPADHSLVMNQITATGAAVQAAVIAEVNANEVKIDGIKERTDNLPDDPADHSLVMGQIVATGSAVQAAIIAEVNQNEVKIDGIKERTDNLPDDPADHSEIISQITTTGATVQSALAAEINENETKIDAVKAKTDLLPSDPADQSDLEDLITTSFTTHESAVISEINANEVKIDAIKAKTDLIPADPAQNGAILSAVAGVKTDTSNIWGKVSPYPDDIWSQSEAEAYIDALETTLAAAVAVVDGNVDTILLNSQRIMGLTFDNSHRHTRVYSGGLLQSEILDCYNTKTGLDAKDPGDLQAKYQATYTYQVGTDKVDELEIARLV